MTDQSPPLDRLTEVETRQQRQEQIVAQIHEMLLFSAQRHQQSALRHQTALRDQTALRHQAALARLNRIDQQQVANAQQIAANAQAIAELQAILRERYNGNG